MNKFYAAFFSFVLFCAANAQTTYTVTMLTDDGTGADAGTLSAAIIAANGSAGHDNIVFDFGAGGPFTIDLSGPLPAITGSDGVTINGWENGANDGTPNTIPVKSATSSTPMDAVYKVILNHASGTITRGIDISGNNSVIKGLVLQNIGSAGGTDDRAINITGNSNQIQGCIIGLDYAGTTSAANRTDFGIYITGTNNIIGDGTAAGANIISGLKNRGIILSSSTSTGNAIRGNMIGLQKDGLNAPAQQSVAGVYLTGTGGVNYPSSISIGGSVAGYGNVISGNSSDGITLTGTSCVVQGNFIGTAADGLNSTVGGGQVNGIQVALNNCIIGGSNATERNIISGNLGNGLVSYWGSSTGTVIKGNYIGLGSDGASIITGNSQDYGIYFEGVYDNITIGGTNTGEGNVISGNLTYGFAAVWNFGGGTYNMYSNIIGLSADGTTYVTGNTQAYGIYIEDNTGPVLGGSNASQRNIISGNETAGIYLANGAVSSSIKGNYIGLQSNGTTAVTSATQDYGIYITGSSYNNVIGGTNTGEGNVISGNKDAGTNGKGIYCNATHASGNKFYGNIIGPQANGTAWLNDNQSTGIEINSSPNNIIGGSASGFRNTISANGTSGIQLTGASATGNQIKGNYIGIASTGIDSIVSSSQDYGVYLTSSANNNTIGGTNPGEGNIIACNDNTLTTDVGIFTNSTHTGGNFIYGNLIGLASNGTKINNLQSRGIEINGSPNNIIGGSSSAYRNVISANSGSGIYITAASSTGNLIKGNYIGIGTNGTTAVASAIQAYGVYITTSANSNIIGGTNNGEANVISGNNNGSAAGVGVFSNSSHTSGNTIIGNTIGPKADADTWLDNNQQYGIQLSSSPNNVIGGSNSSYRNIISANSNVGIYVSGGSSTGNRVMGNYIGLGITGTTYITSSSQDWGIRLVSGNSNIIGGSNPGEGNIISGQGTANGPGINLGSNSNIVYGNIIGARPDGINAVTTNRQEYGFWITGRDNIIGGTTSGMRNIISGNRLAGMVINGASATGNLIKGNYIGLASDGNSELIGNSQDYGIYIQASAVNNVIGGTNTDEGNVISGQGNGAGSGGVGIYFSSNSLGNQIYQNFIGTQKDGSTYVASNEQDYGVQINCPGNTIGGSSSAFRNIISANNIAGIYTNSASASGNVIKGNYIGLASNGTSVIASATQDYGIQITNSSNSNIIGGSNTGEGNVISGNSDFSALNGIGINITSSHANGNTIIGNIIGPQKDGSTWLTNIQGHGIVLENSINNRIGGTTANERNIISANTYKGIDIRDVSTGNTVMGNYIGLASNGTSYIASSLQATGVFISSGGTTGNIIGGSVAGAGNVISGNIDNGIFVDEDSGSNIVLGNIIGLQKDATTFVSSSDQKYGIGLLSNSNVIGGSSSAERNIISGNSEAGVIIAQSNNNIIKGNYIGMPSDGISFITNSAQEIGILCAETKENTIGGTLAGESNLISGQSNDGGGVIAPDMGCGILLYLNDTSNNIIGNIIGPQKDGSSYITNNDQDYGIYIQDAGIDNIIGGSSANYRNIISANNITGVYLTDAATTGNIVKGNYIGISSNGTSFISSSVQKYGVYITNSATGNTVGGTLSGEGNLISGQKRIAGTQGAGVYLDAASNYVYGNTIGPRADGSTYVTSNSQEYGIYIASPGTVGVIIGGTSAGYRNIISANERYGIYATAGITGSIKIQGNYIGTASNGTSIIASSTQNYGIYFNNIINASIGGSNANEGNLISGQSDGATGGTGINLSTTQDIIVSGNIIGPAAGGTSVIAGHTQYNGIIVSSLMFDNTIGGTNSDSRNIISDNLSVGIAFDGSTGGTIAVKGNSIGGDAAGASIGGNQNYGVFIYGSDNIDIGGTSTANDGNIISHNTIDGINIWDDGGNADYNLISRNLIYSNTNKAINLYDGSFAANDGFAPPIINTNYSATTVSGTSVANAVIEVFKKVATFNGDNHCQQAQQYLGTTQANGSGVWTFSPGGTILNAGDTPLATARSNVNNNTSEFACPSTAIGLPIELLYFNAEKINETSVKTYWQTATEINNDFFTIEASSDPSKGGETWLVVGTVAGAGNSSVVLNYQLFDNNITQYSAHSTLYYRLKQTDFDGSYSYSNIVAVDLNKNNSSISNFNIYPNPTTGDNINITITGEVNSEVIIIVRDVLGKELYAKTFIIDNSTNTIQLSDGFSLASGVYTVIASNKNTFVSKKVVVK